MLTDKQFDTAAYELCRLMGRNPNDKQNRRSAEHELHMWLKCMQAIDFAMKAPR